MVDDVRAIALSVQDTERQSGAVVDLLNIAEEHVFSGDIQAINSDISKLAKLHDSLGTSNVDQLQLINGLSDALKECRQETTP